MEVLNMGILSTAIYIANSIPLTWNNVRTTAIFGFFPLLFVIFLVLTIVQLIKVKKNGGRKIKAIVFGAMAAQFGLISLGEVVLIYILSLAISHM